MIVLGWLRVQATLRQCATLAYVPQSNQSAQGVASQLFIAVVFVKTFNNGGGVYLVRLSGLIYSVYIIKLLELSLWLTLWLAYFVARS